MHSLHLLQDEHNSIEGWARWVADKGYELPEDIQCLRTETTEAPRDVPPPLKLPAELSDTAYLIEQVSDYIMGCGDEEWTIHLSLFRPHPPHIASAPYNAMYPMSKLPGTYARAATKDDEAAPHPFLSWALEQYPAADEAELRRARASYYGLITEVDMQLGRLFEQLKERW